MRLFSVLVAIVFFYDATFAFKCKRPKPRAAFKNADVVLTGSASKILRDSSNKKLFFKIYDPKIEKKDKDPEFQTDDKGKYVVVYTGRVGMNAASLRRGERYRIFAKWQSGNLYSSICSGNVRLEMQ